MSNAITLDEIKTCPLLNNHPNADLICKVLDNLSPHLKTWGNMPDLNQTVEDKLWNLLLLYANDIKHNHAGLLRALFNRPDDRAYFDLSPEALKLMAEGDPVAAFYKPAIEHLRSIS